MTQRRLQWIQNPRWWRHDDVIMAVEATSVSDWWQLSTTFCTPCQQLYHWCGLPAFCVTLPTSTRHHEAAHLRVVVSDCEREFLSLNRETVRLRRLHQMRTIAIVDSGVCQSVCDAASLCKHGWTDPGLVWGGDPCGPKERKIGVQILSTDSMRPSLNYFGHFLGLAYTLCLKKMEPTVFRA